MDSVLPIPDGSDEAAERGPEDSSSGAAHILEQFAEVGVAVGPFVEIGLLAGHRVLDQGGIEHASALLQQALGGLHQEVEELAVGANTLQQRRDDEWQIDSLKEFEQLVNRLEERINSRKSVFTGL